VDLSGFHLNPDDGSGEPSEEPCEAEEEGDRSLVVPFGTYFHRSWYKEKWWGGFGEGSCQIVEVPEPAFDVGGDKVIAGKWSAPECQIFVVRNLTAGWRALSIVLDLMGHGSITPAFKQVDEESSEVFSCEQIWDFYGAGPSMFIPHFENWEMDGDADNPGNPMYDYFCLANCQTLWICYAGGEGITWRDLADCNTYTVRAVITPLIPDW
jgi:hypothetical protein